MIELSLYILKMFLLWLICTYFSLKLGILWEKTGTAAYLNELGHRIFWLTDMQIFNRWKLVGGSLFIILLVLILGFNDWFGTSTQGMEPATWLDDFFKIPNQLNY